MKTAKMEELAEIYQKSSLILSSEVPRILLYSNKESICSAIYDAFTDNRLITSIKSVVVINMLKICNENPLVANDIVCNNKKSLAWIRSQFLVIINTMLKRFGINFREIYDLDYLVDIYFEITNIHCMEIRDLRNFYECIDDNVYFTKPQAKHCMPSVKRPDVLLFEGTVEFNKNTCSVRTKVYICDNISCQNNDYIIAKEVLDTLDDISNIEEKASDLCIRTNTNNAPGSYKSLGYAQKMPKRYLSKNKESYFLVSRGGVMVKLLHDRPFACSSCELELKEKPCYSKSSFKRDCTIHSGVINIKCRSYLSIKSGKYVTIGKIFRNRESRPEMLILGYFSRTNEKALSLNKEKNPSVALEKFYEATHPSFISTNILHQTMSIILSIFATKKAKVIIYTNDIDYVKHYSLNYFHMFGMHIPVKFDLHMIDSYTNALFLRPSNSMDAYGRANAEFAFLVNITDSEILYSRKKKGPRSYRLFGKAKMSQESLFYIQKSFVNLRSLFKETVSPPKLLNYIHTLALSLSYIMQRDLLQNDIQFIERLFRDVIVPDFIKYNPGNRRKKTSVRRRLNCHVPDVLS